MEKHQVIIIGAGIAGLKAAATLGEKGVDCIVLEAGQDIGGRIRSINFHGKTVEEGANWVQGVSDKNPVWWMATKVKLLCMENVEQDVIGCQNFYEEEERLEQIVDKLEEK